MAGYYDHLFENNKKKSRYISNDHIHEINYDIEIDDDPDEIVDFYYEELLGAESVVEIKEIANDLFMEGVKYGIQQVLLEEIHAKIEALNYLNSDD